MEKINVKRIDVISELIKLLELVDILERKDIEVKNQKYFEAAKLRDLEKEMIEKIKERISKWN